jgi:hypothetical protein
MELKAIEILRDKKMLMEMHLEQVQSQIAEDERLLRKDHLDAEQTMLEISNIENAIAILQEHLGGHQNDPN